MNPDHGAFRFDKKLFLFISLLLTVITIPLKNNWNSWAIFYFVFAGLIQAPIKEHFKKLWQHRYWMIAVGFFFWLAATWLWDSQEAVFIKVIESYGAFLSLPIIFTIIPRLAWRDIAILCYVFVATIIVVCVVCLVSAYLEYQVTHDEFVFSYHYLSYQAGLNAIFLSNYCLASIIWLLYFNFINKVNSPFRIPAAGVILLCLFFFGMILLLSSKLVIFLTVITLLYFIVRISITRVKNLLVGFFLAALVVVSAAWVMNNLTYLKFRMRSIELKMYSGSADDQNGLAARLLIWDSALELIREKPVIGYGLVQSKEALIEKYQEKGFQIGVKERYNAHNQYLESMLSAGIIGLLLFIGLLFYPLRAACRERKLLLLLMVLHYMLQSFVESTLTVQQELIFFWFFIWLFYFHLPPAGQPAPTISEKQQ